MSVQAPEFSVSPLFYDALSQEFQPAVDPRMHTVGRLAGATVLKGEFEQIEWEDHPFKYARYTYEPTWAEGVQSTVEGIYVSERHIVMTRLRLEADKYADGRWHHWLHIERDTGQYRNLGSLGEADTRSWYENSPEYREAISVELNGTSRWREIELGEKLASARSLVAENATEFFAELDDIQ